MDKHTEELQRVQLEKVQKSLIQNNMEAYIVENAKEAKQLLSSLILDGSSVSVGGSQTLFETGVIDLLRTLEIDFQDRYQEGLSREEMLQIYRQVFLCDYYICSSNAITLNGELYNVDGMGNRVSAITFGPSNVILVVGKNKIVKDIEEAKTRVEMIAAPANCIRLHKDNPCTVIGQCANCQLDTRICCTYVTHKRQNVKNRIKVILVNEDYGY